MRAAQETARVRAQYGLNLREAPDPGSKIIKILPDGCPVRLRGDEAAPRGWTAVKAAGRLGFVQSKFLDLEG